MTKKISDKDKKDWEDFISSDEKLPNKDINLNRKLPSKKRSIDLHGYTLEHANVTVENFIIRSYKEQINDKSLKQNMTKEFIAYYSKNIYRSSNPINGLVDFLK